MRKKSAQKRSVRELAEKLIFRLDDPIAESVAEYSEQTGIAPNLVGRMWTVLMAKNRFHQLPARMQRLEESNKELTESNKQLTEAIIRLIKEFNEAVYDEAA